VVVVKRHQYHLGFNCDGFHNYQTAQKCRFCETQINEKNLAPYEEGEGLMWCCRDDECLSKRNISCDKINKCGHPCRGVRNELECPPCIHEDCVGKNTTNEEDYCNICWVEKFKTSAIGFIKVWSSFSF